jgi:hypothetical protein
VADRSGGADAVEGGEVLVVGVGEGVEVFLGSADLSMTHAVHHRSEVGAAGEEPGGVGVAQVVDADVEVDPGCCDGGSPDAGAEGVPRYGGALAGGEQQIVWPEPPFGDPSASEIGNQDPVLILRILAGSITELDKEIDDDQAELFGGHDRRLWAAGQA